MSKNHGILDDIAKLANSAFSSAINMKNALVKNMKNQTERFIKDMGFVKKEEIEIVRKATSNNTEEIKKLSSIKKNDSNLVKETLETDTIKKASNKKPRTKRSSAIPNKN